MINISVVIPTYKRPDRLERLLSSVAAQALLPQEVLVVDDCSGMPEEYSAVIEKYKKNFESLVFITLPKNSGAPVARNKGIAQSKSDWIALVDDDDEWLPGKLAAQAELIRSSSDPRLGFVYTWARAEGQKGQASYDSCHTVQGDARAALLRTNFILSPSVLIKREALVAVQGFDERLPSCQDWDTWIKIALAGYTFGVVEQVLVLYHRHGGESIGLSPRAKLGYRFLLEKHWIAILRYSSPVNWLKKAVLYFKVRVASHGQA